MVSFLRTLRHSLLSSGKFTKYLAYAIGEILLVVAGILIALQVNNWNEDRLEQEEVRRYLTNISRSLKTDIERMERNYAINEFRFRAFGYLLEKSGQDMTDIGNDEIPLGNHPIVSESMWQGAIPENINSEFVKKVFTWIGRGHQSAIIDYNSIEEMRSVGLFASISDESLKFQISDYYELANWRFGDNAYQDMEDSTNEFEKYLRDEYGIYTYNLRSVDDPLALIKNDRILTIRFLDLRGAINWHCKSSLVIIERAGELVDKIEEYVAMD